MLFRSDEFHRSVGEALDFSRIDAGELDLEPERIPLLPFLRGVVGASTGPVEVRFDTEELSGWKDTYLWMDSGRLDQILSYTLDSASRLCPDGPISLRIVRGSRTNSVRIEICGNFDLDEFDDVMFALGQSTKEGLNN